MTPWLLSLGLPTIDLAHEGVREMSGHEGMVLREDSSGSIVA